MARGARRRNNNQNRSRRTSGRTINAIRERVKLKVRVRQLHRRMLNKNSHKQQAKQSRRQVSEFWEGVRNRKEVEQYWQAYVGPKGSGGPKSNTGHQGLELIAEIFEFYNILFGIQNDPLLAGLSAYAAAKEFLHDISDELDVNTTYTVYWAYSGDMREEFIISTNAEFVRTFAQNTPGYIYDGKHGYFTELLGWLIKTREQRWKMEQKRMERRMKDLGFDDACWVPKSKLNPKRVTTIGPAPKRAQRSR